MNGYLSVLALLKSAKVTSYQDRKRRTDAPCKRTAQNTKIEQGEGLQRANNKAEKAEKRGSYVFPVLFPVGAEANV